MPEKAGFDILEVIFRQDLTVQQDGEIIQIRKKIPYQCLYQQNALSMIVLVPSGTGDLRSTKVTLSSSGPDFVLYRKEVVVKRVQVLDWPPIPF